LNRERSRALRAYRRRRLRYGVLDTAAESDAAQLEAEAMAAGLLSVDAADAACITPGRHDAIIATLRTLVSLGAAAERYDPKLMALLAEVRLIRAAHPRANILIYTEYADSQGAAAHALRHAADVQGEISTISGRDSEAERAGAAERFAAQDGQVLISTDSMAEGLNLQRRCCHLIHLDLPYNPNRLEQRNGRIDRYGQARDPEIRYLYLAGTFEERLLLRLIAKYEKARVRLDVMPDTLGVTADEPDWDKGLVAGFAEDQEALFEDEVPPVRTLDHAAEAGNAAALRDLVHEIDRAFEGFERHAIRHGWLAEQGLNADLRLVRAADRAHERSEAALGGIDLADFVAAAIATESESPCPSDDETPCPMDNETPCPMDNEGPASGGMILHLPGDWPMGLDDLPGYDSPTHTLRVTRDRDRLLTAEGQSLAFLGRAHPLVRRAISRVRRTEIAGVSGTHDTRVSAARSPSGSLAVLLIFGIEIANARRLAHQQVIAVLLPKLGAPSLIEAPAEWLRYGAPERAMAADGVWRNHFTSWVPKRRHQAETLATAAMRRIASHVAQTRRAAAERAKSDLEQWLKLRADGICGAWHPRTSDLFGQEPDAPAWKLLPAPLDRLAAYAAGADNPPASRREANSAVSMFRSRIEDQTRHLAPGPPRLRTIGMLMLVPEE
jgi:hypothetical protein